MVEECNVEGLELDVTEVRVSDELGGGGSCGLCVHGSS